MPNYYVKPFEGDAAHIEEILQSIFSMNKVNFLESMGLIFLISFLAYLLKLSHQKSPSYNNRDRKNKMLYALA